MDTDKIRSDYTRLKAAITAAVPFISSLLRKVRIVLSERVETMNTDAKGILIINPQFWSDLGTTGRAWLLAHGVTHAAFMDAKRMGKKNEILFTISADLVNNELIKEMVKRPSELTGFVLELDEFWYALKSYFESLSVSREDLSKMSKEEIYKLLPGDTVQVIGIKVVSDISKDFVLQEGDAILQEGDPEMYEAEEKEVEGNWRDAITQAYTQQKTAGKVGAGLKRMIERLLEAKVDWRSLLRQAFRFGHGRTVVSTYRRPSRKHSAFPGLRRFTIPTVHFGIDTSGSMSENEITQGISEVYEAAGISEVRVVCWDGEAYEELKAKNQADVISNIMGKIRGGGGTTIGPYLSKVLKNMRPRDIVVVFTDGYIYDIEQDEIRTLLSQVAHRSAVSIFATTGRDWEIPGWRTIRVKVNNA